MGVPRRWCRQSEHFVLLRKVLLVSALVVAMSPSWPVNSQEARAQENPDAVMLNFVNAEIEGVVKVVAEVTGKNFVIDPRVKGTINIVSAEPLPRALVYEVFLSSLRLQGFAAIEDRGIVRIVPEVDAKLYPSPTIGARGMARVTGDRIQTQVQYASTTPSSASAARVSSDTSAV